MELINASAGENERQVLIALNHQMTSITRTLHLLILQHLARPQWQCQSCYNQTHTITWTKWMEIWLPMSNVQFALKCFTRKFQWKLTLASLTPVNALTAMSANTNFPAMGTWDCTKISTTTGQMQAFHYNLYAKCNPLPHPFHKYQSYLHHHYRSFPLYRSYQKLNHLCHLLEKMRKF